MTLSITFDGILDIDTKVRLREGLREKLDAHTPDQRMNLSVVYSEHPRWTRDTDAPGEDIYWKNNWVESFEEYSDRAGQVLDEIFACSEQCVSITAHEGIIQGLLHHIGHPVAQPPTGCAFGILLRSKARSM